MDSSAIAPIMVTTEETIAMTGFILPVPPSSDILYFIVSRIEFEGVSISADCILIIQQE